MMDILEAKDTVKHHEDISVHMKLFHGQIPSLGF